MVVIDPFSRLEKLNPPPTLTISELNLIREIEPSLFDSSFSSISISSTIAGGQQLLLPPYSIGQNLLFAVAVNLGPEAYRGERERETDSGVSEGQIGK